MSHTPFWINIAELYYIIKNDKNKNDKTGYVTCPEQNVGEAHSF